MENSTKFNFIAENECIIAHGKLKSPPLFYQAIDNALFHYFSTAEDFNYLLDTRTAFLKWYASGLAMDYNNSRSTVMSIIEFKRFFELLLKDILYRINPSLIIQHSHGFEILLKSKENDMARIESEPLSFSQTIEQFSKVIACHGIKKNEPACSVAEKYSFLNSGSLKWLNSWYNRLMFNNNTVPNVFLLDYFVSQKFIPLFLQLLITDKVMLNGYRPYYLKTRSNIDILHELSSTELHICDFEKEEKSGEVTEKLLRLAHLKELGRASFMLFQLLNSFLRKNEPVLLHFERNDKHAELQKSNKNFHEIRKCPCCMNESLVVFRNSLKDLKPIHQNFEFWCKCYACTYSIKNNIGDPFHFGYYHENLFPCDSPTTQDNINESQQQ